MSIYRIAKERTPTTGDNGLLGDATPSEIENTRKETIESYVEKAIKLIPADVVAAYLALRNVWLPLGGNSGDILGDTMRDWVLPIAGLVTVIVSRILGTSPQFGTLKDIQWTVIIVSSFAYVAWVLSFNDPIFGVDTPDPRLSATLLIIISIFGPSLVLRMEKD